jgi:hypothetical protein
MEKENVGDTHNGGLLSLILKEEWNYVICWEMDGTKDHCVKWNKHFSQRQVSHVFSHLWKLGKIKQQQKNKIIKVKGRVLREVERGV